jgi:hypothetical protein
MLGVTSVVLYAANETDVLMCVNYMMMTIIC